jgi:hypothetical protein
MMGIFEFLLVAGGGLIIWEIITKKKKCLRDSVQKEDSKKEKLKLEDISLIWTKKKKAKVKLEELAKIWRNFEITQELADTPHFFTPVIKEFFEKHLQNRPFYTGKVRVVINNILTLLDMEGGVASVVSGQYETESKIPEDTYKMLAMVSLAEHTIHVAEEMLNLVPYGPNLPPALIAALAHDLGKIPKYRKQYYSLGDHAFISMTVLEGIQGFKDLIYADEVLQAVRDHHLKPKNFLGEKLKEADTKARRRELIEVQRKLALSPPSLQTLELAEPNVDLSEELLQEEQGEIKEGSQEKEEEREKKNKKKKKKSEVQITTLEEVDEALLNKNEELGMMSVFGIPSEEDLLKVQSEENKESMKSKQNGGSEENKESKENKENLAVKEKWNKKDKVIPKELEVSNFFVNVDLDALKEKEEKEKQEGKPVEIPLPWFNPEEFLQRLLPHVNKLDEKGRWNAISMPNGVVYVQPRLFWNILVEMAKEKNIIEIFYYEESPEMKRNCLYSVLKQLQKHKDAIETSLIKDGFFSAPFYVKLKDGRTLSRALYVPLKACEAFGVSVGELEARKKGKLLEIEDIVPPYEEEKGEEDDFGFLG